MCPPPQQHGITQANQLVNLNDFFVNHILTDLKSPNGKNLLENHLCLVSITSGLTGTLRVVAVNEFPVLKADAIKYVMIFRSQVRVPPSPNLAAFWTTDVLRRLFLSAPPLSFLRSICCRRFLCSSTICWQRAPWSTRTLLMLWRGSSP